MKSFILRAHLKMFAVLLAAIPGVCAQSAPAPYAAADTPDHGDITATGSHEAPQQRRRPGSPERGVYKSLVAPHWLAGNTKFWYRNDLPAGAKEFFLVDVENGVRAPVFDSEKLASELSLATGGTYAANQPPFAEIEFTSDGHAVQFTVADKTWQCDLNSYRCSVITNSLANQPGQDSTQNQPPNFDAADGPVASPDGHWTAFVKAGNLYLRSVKDGHETQLSHDGATNRQYQLPEWSPDSQTLVAWRVEPADIAEVYLVQSSPPAGGRAVLKSRPYAQAGDRFPRYELNLFHLPGGPSIKPIVDPFEHEWEMPRLHWQKDGLHFTCQQEDRGHQRLRLIEVDARDGACRNLIDERTPTFIWTAHMEGPESLGIRLFTYLTNSDELIYASERDGWRHLYLVDPKTGGIKNQITKGEWVVRGIRYIDEDRRQIWFLASGMNAGEDPYFLHYYRVNFDGSGLVALTDGNGNHTAQFSPDRKFLVDTYSRPDHPPVTVLRRSADGALICPLESADISELQAIGWEPPEVFVAKGRDGQTDIWGNIYRPRHLDPAKKYPVIEDIYAGPQDSYTPKSFSSRDRYAWYNEHGFIVVELDAMGTANRSKAFHDVCWHDLKDAGFPDRILWIKAAAKKYPYLDLDRVGLFGTSSGGQSAAGALLFHSDFYKVAVANCGCHDNRLDKASWNEQWMGYLPHDQLWRPGADNWYAQCSNIDNAPKLRGHLLLIVGEMDANVPPESTLRFVDALIRADKTFDMLVVPNADHGAPSGLTTRKTHEFFQRHLLHEEPADETLADTKSK